MYQLVLENQYSTNLKHLLHTQCYRFLPQRPSKSVLASEAPRCQAASTTTRLSAATAEPFELPRTGVEASKEASPTARIYISGSDSSPLLPYLNLRKLHNTMALRARWPQEAVMILAWFHGLFRLLKQWQQSWSWINSSSKIPERLLQAYFLQLQPCLLQWCCRRGTLDINTVCIVRVKKALPKNGP